MKEDVQSAAELLDLLDRVVDDPIFNNFHASAAYTSLAMQWKGGLTPSDKESPVLPRLAARVEDMALKGQLEPRQVSNVFWSLGQLSDGLDISKSLLMALVKSLGEKASGMKPQELANSLWAATRLKDDAREVLQMVPALVKEIPRNQGDFSSQQICNCLEALVLLQDSVRKVNDFLAAPPNSKNDFVGFAASRFSTLLPTLNRKSLQFDIPVVVWACARVKLDHEELLVSVAERLKSSRDLKTLPDWGLCALLWSYDVLDPDTRFAEFKNALESERVRRGLSDADVSESAFGYFEWNRAKGQKITS